MNKNNSNDLILKSVTFQDHSFVISLITSHKDSLGATTRFVRGFPRQEMINLLTDIVILSYNFHYIDILI
jgi:hypothetical protein